MFQRQNNGGFSPFLCHCINAINKVIKVNIQSVFADQSGSGSKLNPTSLRKNVLPFSCCFHTDTCRCTSLHTTHPSEELQSGCCLHRCLVFPQQHTAVCFYWPSESTEAPLPWSLLPPHHNHSVRVGFVKRVNEKVGEQRMGASELLPYPRGVGRGRINKTECGHQGLVPSPSGNVRPRMTQPPTHYRGSGETRPRPNSFQTIQNRPVNHSLTVTKCQLTDESLCRP